jgi:hypothetical protein
MEYGHHVVHYTAPTIDIYVVELAGEEPLPSHYKRLGEAFYDGTADMCCTFLDDLWAEIGGTRITAGGRESLVVSAGPRQGEPPRRPDMHYGPFVG